MLYHCYTCGWIINGRTVKDKYENITTNYEKKDTGEHLTYKNLPFCTQLCIEEYKLGLVKKRASPQDYWENGIWGNWKIERKINRVRNKGKK